MLTLSHLLYRRSPPAANLSDVIHALLLGLSFERRSAASGGTASVGSNVRDAACFGIWALARRYSTAEILAVPTKTLSVSSTDDGSIKASRDDVSMLQIIATELVVTACLDPAGNIRRGSSAALQELIGRHPDLVEKGIWVVQTVDYHAVAPAVARRRRGGPQRRHTVEPVRRSPLDALLGWRGIGDADAAARRRAASAFGLILNQVASAATDPLRRLAATAEMARGRLLALQRRQADERHGILLSLAAVLDAFPSLVKGAEQEEHGSRRPLREAAAAALIRSVADVLETVYAEFTNPSLNRRPELVAEAASRLVVSSFPVLEAAVLDPASYPVMMSGPAFVSDAYSPQRERRQQTLGNTVSAIDARLANGHGAVLETLRRTSRTCWPHG